MEQVCPVCGGNGTVQPGFYQASPGQIITLGSTSREKCRRCNGLGTISTKKQYDIESPYERNIDKLP